MTSLSLVTGSNLYFTSNGVRITSQSGDVIVEVLAFSSPTFSRGNTGFIQMDYSHQITVILSRY